MPNFLGKGVTSATAKLLLASFLAGAGWLFSLQVLNELSPLLFIGSRFLLAGLLVGAVIGDLASLLRRRVVLQLLPGASMLALSMIFWILGLARTEGPGVAAFITASGNLFVPVWGLVLFGWSLQRSTVLSLGIALVGLAFLFVGPGAKAEVAHLMFLIAAGFWACSIALVKYQLSRLDTRTTTAGQLFLSGAMILVVALPVEGQTVHVPSLQTVLWFLASLILSTYLRFLLQFDGQKEASTAQAGLIMSVEPIWALLLTTFFLGEITTITQVFGCGIVIAAVAKEGMREKRVKRRNFASRL